MDPPPLQPSDIDLSSSAIPPTVTSVPDDQNQTLTKQNPSSPPADSDAVQTLLHSAPDPPNSDPENHLKLEDPDDQEGMISDANVDGERLSSPPSRSARRTYRRSKSLGKRKLAFIEKKSQALAKNMKPVPFVPSKVLDFSKHEEGLRKLGLWDFAHLEFDRKVRNDLIAKLIVNYNDKTRASYVDDFRFLVNQTDMARALNLPCKKPADFGEVDWSGDFISFVDKFVSSWMLLHEDTWVLPSEVMAWIEMIKGGHPEKVEWAKLIWFMIKRELSQGSHLVNCYYASHLQRLIKCQKEVLFKEKSPDKVEEIIVVKDDDEDEGHVKMLEYDEDSHGGEREIDTENAPSAVEEDTGSVPSDVKMEGNADSLGSGDGTTEHAVQVENKQTSGDQVENPMVTSDQEETLKTVGDHGDSLNTIDDHVKNLDTAVDQVENLETAAAVQVDNLETAAANLEEDLKPAAVDNVESLEAVAVDCVENHGIASVDHVQNQKPDVVDHVENLETASFDHVKNLDVVDQVENLKSAVVDHVENLKPDFVDHVENLEIVNRDHLENVESTGDVVENMKPSVDHVEYLELMHEHVENLEQTNDVEDMNIDGDHVEDMNIDGDHVGEDKKTVNAMEDINTEADIVIPVDDDDAEIQETECNDLIDFGVCKEDEHDPWDLSIKDSEQQHFLQHCTMTEPKHHEKQQPGHEEEDDDNDHEDDEPVQGFGLSSGHLIQSQIPEFENHHVMLGGPSSIFGKRALDLDPEISTHKRARTDTQDVGFIFEQIQQWAEKGRLANMSTQQTTMSQQQMLFDEIGSKDHLIQQLKMNNDELQRRRQAEIARYENELYAMNSIIEGYRKALRSTQKSFDEYRKKLMLPAEPLYKDAGEGGVVKTVAELEREKMKRKAARIVVEGFEKEWKMKFERHVEETEKLEARVCEIVKGVELVKEFIGKRKASEMVS